MGDDRVLEDMCIQRDLAEDALADAYVLVMGAAPEWSSAYGFKDALRDMERKISEMQQTPKEPET